MDRQAILKNWNLEPPNPLTNFQTPQGPACWGEERACFLLESSRRVWGLYFRNHPPPIWGFLKGLLPGPLDLLLFPAGTPTSQTHGMWHSRAVSVPSQNCSLKCWLHCCSALRPRGELLKLFGPQFPYL